MSEIRYRITRLEPQKRRADRFNVYLDDAFAFGLDQEVAVRHALHEGDEISESMINEVLLAEELAKAKNKALALLSYRSRSVQEIKEKLKEKGIDERIIDQTVDDFLRVGLLNDQAFASAYAQTRMIQKPMSKRLLLQELTKKGVAESAALPAIEESYGNQTEESLASEIVSRRMGRYRKDPPQKARKKIADFLARRGFSWDVIQRIIQQVELDDLSENEEGY